MKTDKLMNSSGQSAADIVVELLRLEPVTEASVEKNFGRDDNDDTTDDSEEQECIICNICRRNIYNIV